MCIHKVINTNSFWKSPDQILSITILKGIYYNSMHVIAILVIHNFDKLSTYVFKQSFKVDTLLFLSPCVHHHTPYYKINITKYLVLKVLLIVIVSLHFSYIFSISECLWFHFLRNSVINIRNKSPYFNFVAG